MREINRHSAVAFVCAALMLLVSCYPGGPTSASDRDLVTTFFEPNANFGAIRTYAMPNEVVILDDEAGSLPADTEALILSTIARNMESIGYRREMNPENNGTDVVLLVASNQRTTITYWVNYLWWGPWGGWCPGYIACHHDAPCDQDLLMTAHLRPGSTHDVDYNVTPLNGSWSVSLVAYWYE